MVKERVIGDLHFFGKEMLNIIPRPFSTVEAMNAYMIEAWNAETSPDDIVFVVGDFFDAQYCTKQEMFTILDSLNGTKILIVGNHDRPFVAWYKEYGMTVIEYPILKDQFWILSHEPQFVSEAAPYANIFAHVHLNPMYKDVSSRSICVSAERLNYRPMLLSEAKKKVMECANKENATQ